MAARFSTHTSGQIPGWPAAMRVMSRKPPAARRSSDACSSAAPRPGSSAPRPSDGERGTPWPPCRRGGPLTWRPRRPRATTPQRGPGRRRRVGRFRRGEDPGGALEQVGVGAVDAFLLGPRHGVAADEAGIGGGAHDGRLDARHVGHHGARPMGQRRGRGCRHRAGGGGHERDVGVGIGTDGIEGAQLEGALLAWDRGRSPSHASPAGAGPARSSRRSGRCRPRPPAGCLEARIGHLDREVIVEPPRPFEIDVVQLGPGRSVFRCMSTRMHSGSRPRCRARRRRSAARRRDRSPAPPSPGTSSGCRRWR